MEKKSMYHYYIPPEYRSLIDDIFRMMTLQISTHFFLNISNPSKYPLFSEDFFQYLSYIILGICLYWLVVRKVILFDKKDTPYKEQGFYYGSSN